jgi:hypothetical protein
MKKSFSKSYLTIAITTLLSSLFMAVTPLSEPLPDDDFKIFLEKQTYVSNVFLMQSSRLTQGHAGFEIWAGSYWPIHQGLLGLRFADPLFPRSKVFIENYNDYLLRPSELMVMTGFINRLSPAEKYDLLVGDSNWTLTKAMWARGNTTLQKYGSVPTWTGICHGWSAAVHMGTKAPRSSVVVTDVTGQHHIEFYRQDIKALMSYLWAETETSSLNAGNRCRQDIVIKDPYQRPIDISCLDTNPMSWHMAVINKIGLHAKSFVMDSTSGSEVWNFAVKGYDYSYFNPRTFVSTHNLKAAIEPIENMTADKFKNYRSPRARYIVGVIMDVMIPSIITPQVSEGRGDKTKTENFVYDLELDENYNIIGGEWHSLARPDFMWTYASDARPFSGDDLALVENWDVDSRLPDNYAARAREASGRGKVLGRIAETLHRASIGE